MDLDLDKEIDALLRRKDFGPDGTGVLEIEHLGADEISAFAENALPDAGRAVYMRHLAVCGRCRTVLSNVIALNSESDERREESAAPIVESAVSPWYRGLFSLPGLAYTMGGLAVIFAGFLAFSILRDTGGGPVEVSQDSQRRLATPEVPSAAEQYPESVYTANSAANSNAGSAATAVPGSGVANAAANTAVVAANPAAARPAATATSDAPSQPNRFQADGSGIPPPPPPPPASTADAVTVQSKDDKLNEKERSNLSLSARRVDEVPLTRRAEEQEYDRAPPKRRAPEAKAKVLSGPSRDMNSQIQNSANQISQLPLDGRNASGLTSTRTIAGRVFELKQGVWYDKSFAGERTINVRRGTDAYSALDAGLRNAADSLGGTVVIVWKSKAYRIQ